MNGWGEIVAANLRDVIDRRDQAGEMVTNEIANKAASNDRVRWSDGAAQPMTEKRIGMIHRNVPARVWRIRKVERGEVRKSSPLLLSRTRFFRSSYAAKIKVSPLISPPESSVPIKFCPTNSLMLTHSAHAIFEFERLSLARGKFPSKFNYPRHFFLCSAWYSDESSSDNFFL